MHNDGDRRAQARTHFIFEGRMEIEPKGTYATPSDRATVTVSQELTGEMLERFRSFVGHGYPQVPYSMPPTSAAGFDDLRVEVTLRWPPFVEEHVRAYQARLQEAADEFSQHLEELPPQASKQQKQILLDAYHERTEDILNEFDEQVDYFKGPPENFIAGARWDIAERRYERWVYAATERLSGLLSEEDLSETEELLLNHLRAVTRDQDPEQVRQTAAVLCDTCGGDEWYVRQAEPLEGDAEGGVVHLDAINLDTHQLKRLVLRMDELSCSSSDDLKALHARLSSDLPRAPANVSGAAAEALGFVGEMRENLWDAWEAAEDLGVEEEIHRVRLAIEELESALASEELRASEENE
jgi:hypothetical protein